MTDQAAKKFSEAATAIWDGTASTEEIRTWIDHLYRASCGELGEKLLRQMLEKIEKQEEDIRSLMAGKAELNQKLQTTEKLYAADHETLRVTETTLGKRAEELDRVKADNKELQAQAIPQFIRDMADRLTTQDNRCTADPFFNIFQKREIVVAEGYGHNRIVWFDEEGNEADEELKLRLEAARDEQLEDEIAMDGGEWVRLAVKEIDEFVTGCFTEEGCKQHLKINGHNLRKPFIYANSLFRNEEMLQLREWIISQKAQEAAQ